MVSGGNDGTARLWEVATGKEVSRLTLDGGYEITPIVFSPDGKYVVTGSYDGTARVLEFTTGREISHMTLGNIGDGVNLVKFSPDGKYVFTGSVNGTARVWDVFTGKEVFSIHGGQVNRVAFSPDGKYIVLGSDNNDGTISVREVITGKEVARMTSNDQVYTVAFSPDGKYVIAGGGEVAGENSITIYIWEATTGKEVSRLPQDTYDGAITSVAFSPDEKYVFSVAYYGTVRIWLWQPADLIPIACESMPRNLTRLEWSQYIGDALPYQSVCTNLPLQAYPTPSPVPESVPSYSTPLPIRSPTPTQ